MLRRHLLIPVLFVMAATAHAAELDGVPPPFASFGVAEGLPSSWVYVIEQDRDGYLWFGTHDGLARHDGVETQVFRTDPADPQSIGGNDIATVLVDRRGRLWAGGEGSGLNRLDPGSTRFVRYRGGDDPVHSLAGDDVFALAEGNDGRIWAALYGAGLAVLDDGGRVESVRHDEADPGSLRSDNVLSLRVDATGRLWIGTDRGLDLRETDGRIRHVDLGLSAKSDGPMVYAFWPEADGGMLVGTRNGLVRIDAALGVAGKPLLDESVTSLLRDRDGILWVGTRSGVVAMRGDEMNRYQPREGLSGFFPGHRVFSILQDREGGLWFATIDGGVGRLRPHWRNFATLRHVPGDSTSLSHAAITALAADGDAVWAISADDGLDRIDARNGTLTREGARLGTVGGRLTAVLGVDDALWVGHRGGIRVLATGTTAPTDLPVDATDSGSIPVGPITVLRRAPDGAVWAVALGGGVARIDPRSRRIERFDVDTGQLASADVRALEIDADGRVWLASGVGIERHLPGSRGFQRIPELAHASIDALALAGNGSLWLHHADGLDHYRSEAGRFMRQESVGSAEGLPALAAAALTMDGEGSLWMTSTRGLWRLRQGVLSRFGESDGLPGVEFAIGALSIQESGRIWAATRSGVVGFDPRALQSELPLPAVRTIEAGVRRDGMEQRLDPAREIVLGHADREFSVKVRAFSFADPGSHRHRFRMSGVDTDWIDTGPNGERVFTRLDAGEYVLEAAANAGSGWNPLAAPLRIRVNPAPWRTPAAYAAYGVVTLLLMALAVHGWQRRLHRRHELQLALQRQQAAEQLALAKSNFLATMSHEIRTPLTGVLGMAELLMHARLPDQQRGQVQAIHKSGELLLRLVNDIVDLARIEAGRFTFEPRAFDPSRLLEDCLELARPLARRRGLGLHLDVREPIPRSLLGDPLRIEQILLNLVNNALKFTERGEVRVDFGHAEPDGLLIHVRDTGPGIEPELLGRLFQRFEQAEATAGRPGGSGLGLAISRELVELMGGHIGVDSTPGVGSCFHVTLPLPLADMPVESAPASTATSGTPLSVLLVEDDPIVAAVIGGLLESLGHHSQHAADGLAALGLAKARHFDLALLDLDLPGIDGVQLAGLLRRTGFDQGHRTLLAVSANIGVDEARMLDAGLDGFVRKPVSAESLSVAIERARSRSQANATAVP